MKRTHTILIAITVLLAACGPAGPSVEQIDATAQHFAATGVALTLTAWPTNTALPTETPEPTSTPLPSDTSTPEPTATATFAPTWTPFGQLESTDFGTAQADKADKNAPLVVQNNTGESVQFFLLSPFYQEYQLANSMTIILPEGSYSFRYWVGNQSPRSGSFNITNGDKHVLTLYEDKYHFATP